ncbi:MAG: hypothetical protein EAX87_09235 [Candidatus Thorarchaeota archaeon]|nr:hypothetical protein [Candidatus Thorarchaeota archaeon]
MDIDKPFSKNGVNMDVRLRRASRALALTLLIVLTTALVSIWANNPPPPVSWEMSGNVSYIDTMFSIEIPTSFNISHDVDVDEPHNTTRIYVEIRTELILNKGLLNFGTYSTYIVSQSLYSVSENERASLSSKSSSKDWNVTLNQPPPFRGWGTPGLNETFQQNRTYPIEYSLRIIWNCSLTLVEERGNDTRFNLELDFRIRFNETQTQVNPALFPIIFKGECIVGTVVTIGFYVIDKPRVID